MTLMIRPALQTVKRWLSRSGTQGKPGTNNPDTASAVTGQQAVTAAGEDVTRDAGIDLVVATAVLDVADLLSSPELRRRLAKAVSLLPGVEVIAPGQGVAFDPDRHQWAHGETAPSPALVKTIAETKSAGLADRNGLVRRPARVVVYDTPKEQQ